jgi:hypothetical protein
MKNEEIIQFLLSNEQFVFINNKYLKYYVHLIINAKQKNRIKRKKSDLLYEYYERHHILPESFGGPNTKDNLVFLTLKEHLIAHHLLTKCTTGSAYHKMVCALHRTFFGNKKQKEKLIIGSNLLKIYEKNKIKLAEINEFLMKDRWTDEKRKQHGESISGEKNGMFGVKRLDLIEINKNRIGSNHPLWNKQRSSETKIRIKKTWTIEKRKQHSDSNIGSKNGRYVHLTQEQELFIKEKQNERMYLKDIPKPFFETFGIKIGHTVIGRILKEN